MLYVFDGRPDYAALLYGLRGSHADCNRAGKDAVTSIRMTTVRRVYLCSKGDSPHSKHEYVSSKLKIKLEMNSIDHLFIDLPLAHYIPDMFFCCLL